MLIRNSNLPAPLNARPAAIRRPSRAVSPYVAQHGFADAAIAPIDGVRGGPVSNNRSFSAQLLELGLQHQVEGLINKASDQLAAQQGVRETPYDRYEAAQQNFADPHLVRWYV
jgi:hypothetical protein